MPRVFHFVPVSCRMLGAFRPPRWVGWVVPPGGCRRPRVGGKGGRREGGRAGTGVAGAVKRVVVVRDVIVGAAGYAVRAVRRPVLEGGPVTEFGAVVVFCVGRVGWVPRSVAVGVGRVEGT